MTTTPKQTSALSDLPPAELLSSLSFCVFDLETTGGNHQTDKIIEIGMVKIENFEIVATMDYLIRPEMKIPDFIQKLTNISQEDVEDAPKIEEIIDEILNFMGDSLLVAHNTSFDVPFFNSVLKRLGKTQLQNPTLCTNLMTKYLIPNLMNSNLNYMSKIFDIEHNKAHRALDDAYATAVLLLNYLHIFKEKGIKKINHLYYPRNKYELDRANFKAEEPLENIEEKLRQLKTPALVTLKGENGIILYALPFRGSHRDLTTIGEKLKSIDWKTATIKLYGPLIEVITHLNNVFTKLEAPVRQEVLRHIWEEYLPHLKEEREKFQRQSQRSSSELTIEDNKELKIIDEDFGDFFITHHLVPEQLIIYPIQSMHPKSELIFRYPGHKKKLLQYINSKSTRLEENRLKKVYFHPALKEFVDFYLRDCKEKQKELFIFSKRLPEKNPNQFFSELDLFLGQNPNPYNYPKNYI